jgi:hypothetical protein
MPSRNNQEILNFKPDKQNTVNWTNSDTQQEKVRQRNYSQKRQLHDP